jgi:lysyl-tRNA synthetase class 2
VHRPGRLHAVGPPPLLPPRGTRLPRLVALCVALAGLTTLASALLSPLRSHLGILDAALPLALRTQATSVAVLSGFGTLVIAGALARRQRRAWWLALILLLTAGVSHLVKDVDVLQAGWNFGLALVLVSVRREFHAPPTPTSLRRAVLALPLLAGSVWLFGMAALLIHGDDVTPQPSVAAASAAAARGAVGMSLNMRIGESAEWIHVVLPLLGVMAVVVSFAMVFRPVVETLMIDSSAADRARNLVRRYGSDTLAYFSLRADKNYFLWGDVVISYVYLWSLGLVSGDPVGDPEQVPGAIEAFVRYARERGWGVAVLAGGGELSPVYASLGLRSFYLGDEAVVDPQRFSLQGRPIRKVRQSCRRLERAGYRLEFLSDADVDDDLRKALASISRSWRGRAPERGFTMALGRPPSAKDPECLTVVARDGDGRDAGYLHLVPCYGSDPGYSLDQMRRRPDTPNGLMEWLIAMTIQELASRGVRRFSLNFAFLGALFRAKGTNPLHRVEVAAVRRLNPFFQIESLHSFNAKFFPEWRPRYIYYEPPLSLPRVSLAYLEAEAFLRLPLVGVRGRFREGAPWPDRRTPAGSGGDGRDPPGPRQDSDPKSVRIEEPGAAGEA